MAQYNDQQQWDFFFTNLPFDVPQNKAREVVIIGLLRYDARYEYV